MKTGDVVHCSPAISRGTLYIGSWDMYLYVPATMPRSISRGHAILVRRGRWRHANVYAVEAKTGKQGWFYSTEGSRIDLKTQKPAWVFQNDTSQQKPPTIQNPDGTLRFGVNYVQKLL